MLIGEFEHNIDQKGRVIIPARFRDDFGSRFIITKGPENCLFIYSIDEWRRLENSILGLPMTQARRLQLFFFSSASETEADKQGRAVIPAKLREYARLEKQVVIIGASNHAEIWDKELWDQKCGMLTPETIMQAMEDIGF